VLAKSVDVVELPVYYWREREGPDRSITQRRTELKGFLDRASGVDWVSRFLAENKQTKVKRWYDASALRGDLYIFMRVLPDVDEEYQRAFLDRCNDFLDRVADGVVDSLHTSLRVQWHLVRERMLPELLTVILATRDLPSVPTVRRGFKRYHDLPFLDAERPELPRELFRAGTPTPTTVVHRVTLTDGKLHVRGHAFIHGSRAPRPLDAVRMLWLNGADGRRAVPVLGRPRRCPDATLESKHAACSYEWSGFDAAISLRSLRDKDGQWADGDWTIAVGVVAKGQASRGPLRMGGDARMLEMTPQYVDDAVRVKPIVVDGALGLRVEKVVARATAFRVADEAVEIEGELRGAAPRTATIRLSRVRGVTWQSYPVELGEGRFRARIPLSDLPAVQPPPVVGEVGDRWRIYLVADDDQPGGSARSELAGPAVVTEDFTAYPVVADGHVPDFRHPLGPRELRLQPTWDSYLELAVLPAGPVVTSAVWTADETLQLSGDLPAATADRYADLEIVLRIWGRREQRTFPAEVQGTTWRAVIDPLSVSSYAGPIQLRTGQWDVLCRHAGSEEEDVEQLPFAGVALEQLPVRGTAAHRQLVLCLTREERTSLRVEANLDIEEQGVYGQSRLRDRVYPQARTQPLRDAVLYNSFTGRQYSDSPRAVHEELVARGLPLEHLWVVQDGQVALPEHTQEVRYSGREWYEAYATSRYIVTNQHLPDWFRRREGQVVVQTWHGTPLKRIAHDISDVRFADPLYLEKLAVETGNWSVLLSPNRFSTPILRRAFRYEGELLESGYPRNDVLCRGTEAMAEQVRARLGLPAGKKVVLYAPTWRDDEYYGPGRYKISMQLDLDRTAEALGDDHVLLVRRHPNVVDEIPQAGGGFVWDVSTYPDIADLLAATDILVTDYSSVMFDFANTGRPMLFFTYDLEHYRDRLRGFYIDFEAEAPGPLLATSDEVIEAIRGVDEITARYVDAYRAFAETACDLDDGHATSRVVDRLLAG
jgi:CDP-glycerol glycerophosphotransferase